MAERDLRRALLDDLEEIEHSADAFRKGRHSAYQTCAIQMRNLLLRGRRGLLLRVLPEATLRALRPPNAEVTRPDRPGEYSVVRFDPRGHLELGGEAPGARLYLDFINEPLSVEQWLNQWILDPKVTIRALIEKTADDEVAHTNNEIDEAIKRANFFRFAGRPQGMQLHAMTIVALAEHVAQRTREMLVGR